MKEKIIIGDCRDAMRDLIARGVRVQTCVTSPPYFGLRDYGVDGQIGLEQTPDEYVANMVEVFRLVRDLLADDGTLWLNLGDSYAGSRPGPDTGSTLEGSRKNQNAAKDAKFAMTVSRRRDDHVIPRSDRRLEGLKPKDLIGIPWRVAFALQADGWYLRQDIIWSKPNPMPESVRDRCTKAHEYIFLLSKSERYYFDAEAIKEPVAASSIARLSQRTLAQQAGSLRANGGTRADRPASAGNTEKRNKRSVWTVSTKPFRGAHFATFPADLIAPCVLAGSRAGDVVFDPFIGSGTTAEVAILNGRDFLGCELNPDYSTLHAQRIEAARRKVAQMEFTA